MTTGLEMAPQAVIEPGQELGQIPATPTSSGSSISGSGSSAPRQRRVWTPEEDEHLRLLVSYWGDQCGKNGHWDKISSHFKNRSSKDCRKRWFHSLDPKLKRGRWTEHEDKVLMAAYDKMGPVWHRIAQLIPGRTDDQCSKRYNDVLDPKISDRLRPWSPAEDSHLLEMVEMHGTKWRTISKEMEGRTGLTCRNRWRKLVNGSQGRRKPVTTPPNVVDMIAGGLRDDASTDSLTSTSVNSSVISSTPMTNMQVLGDIPSIGSPTAATAPNRTEVTNPIQQFQYPTNMNVAAVAPANATTTTGPLGANYSHSTPNMQFRQHPPPHSYTYSVGEGGPHTSISRQDLEVLVAMAAKAGQSIVIHQHNYHYYCKDGRQDPPTRTPASAATPAPPPPSQDFLDIEVMDMSGDEFPYLGDSDLGLGLEDFHGIPFNPS